jgi:hypothetical protein
MAVSWKMWKHFWEKSRGKSWEDAKMINSYGERGARSLRVISLGRPFYRWLSRLHIYILVGGIPTPLKKVKVRWDDDSQYMGK